MRFGMFVASPIVLLVACSTVAGPVARTLQIVTDRSEYGPGALVSVTFTNGGAGLVYCSGCLGVVLERRSGRTWSTLGPGSDTVACRASLLILAPGQAHAWVLPLPAGLDAGVYRYRFDSVLDSLGTPLAETERTSNVFSVVRGP